MLPKTSCKPLVCKPKAAKLRFASLTKQSFVWRQNSSPKAAKLLAEGGKTPFCKPYKAKLCMAAKLLAEGGKPLVCKPYKAKLCMAAKLLAFGLQALQSKALYGGKTSRRRRQTFGLQALQSKALYGGKTLFCKPYKAKLCMAFAQEGPQKHVAYKASLKLELRLKKGLQVLFVHCFVSAALPVLTNARFCFFKQEGVSTALASVLTSLFYKKYGPIFTTK